MEIQMVPIGYVYTERTSASDDYWGGVLSKIMLDEERFATESLAEIGSFSHLEMVFYFHITRSTHVLGAGNRVAATRGGRRRGAITA